MPTTFYFAWVAEGAAFNAAVHNREDEQVFALAIAHSEGEFPTLAIDVRNPRVGLLAAGRNLWCWLSWNNGGGVQPLFNGRLIGIPQSLADEVVRLQFVARPPDFIAQKEALAASLRVLPWFDRVWLQESLDDPDTVLETRTARWHIDRLTLDVTASDVIEGEGGTITVGEADHLYDDMEVSYGEAPLRRVRVVGTVSWTQTGSGDVDLSRDLIDAFRAVGSPFDFEVASLTGEGLLSSWPEPLTNIGGGWTVGAGATIEPATWLQEQAYVVQWLDPDEDEETLYQQPLTPREHMVLMDWANWEAAFLLSAYLVQFPVHYDAERDRSETVTASIEADVQSLIVDPGAAEEETIELASAFVGEPVDPDAGSPGAFDIPIGDLRRNSYFKTARGAQSFEYLLLLARAKLVARARAVQISFVTTWAVASAISCRHNVRLVDNRLPGGEATGKVIAYTLSASGEGEVKAEVTIGCTIGYGVPLGAPASGTPVYADTSLLAPGIQAMTGAETALIAGELLYESFDNFEVTDDDGVNLLDMSARTVVNSLTVTGGPTAQIAAIDASLAAAEPDPVGALRDTPTVVTLDLVPVTGGAFHVDFDVTVSELVIPQTINLEAA